MSRWGRRSSSAAYASVALCAAAGAALAGSYFLTDFSVRGWLSETLIGVAGGLLAGLILFLVVSLGHERVLEEVTRTAAREGRVAELVALARMSGAEARRSFGVLEQLGALEDGSLRGRSLAGADLRGIAFDGADLRGVDFSGSILRSCSFIGARVDGAHFESADLCDAILEFASAGNAHFEGAKIDDRSDGADAGRSA